MKVLISIKPKYVEKIFSGTKKYEFRRAMFKNRDVSHMVIYASSPVQKVIGEVEIGEIVEGDFTTLWEKTKHDADTDKNMLKEYFAGKEKCFAIQIKSVKKYKDPKTLADFGIKFAPQSFVYVSD